MGDRKGLKRTWISKDTPGTEVPQTSGGMVEVVAYADHLAEVARLRALFAAGTDSKDDFWADRDPAGTEGPGLPADMIILETMMYLGLPRKAKDRVRLAEAITTALAARPVEGEKK